MATQRDILIRTILGEAADQGELGWSAVANVIRNRMRDGRWPRTPAGVALQPNQFSAWNDKSRGGNDLVYYRPGQGNYDQIGQVVDRVFSGQGGPDPTRGSVYYYAPSGMPGGRAPSWWNNAVAEHGGGFERIGGHLFAGKQRGGIAGGEGSDSLLGSAGADTLGADAGDTPGLTGGIVDVNNVNEGGVLSGGMGGNIGWGDGPDRDVPIQLGKVDVIGAKPAGSGGQTGGLGDLIMGLGAGAAAGASAAPGNPLDLGGEASAAGAQLGQSASAAPANQRALAPSQTAASTSPAALPGDIFGNLTAQIAGRQSGPFTRAAGVSTAGRQPKIRR